MNGDVSGEQPRIVNALAFSNYRRFVIGQVLSNVGTWFQLLAQSLLVLKLTGKGSALGEVFAAQTLPALFLGPFIGPFLDRTNVRRILLVISVLAGLEALALGVLTATGRITVDRILLLALLLGFAQLFLQPGIQTFLSELVPGAAIPNAVSLNAVAQSAGRLAGPAIAAVVYAWRGPATCFVVNAISYLVITVAIASLRRDRLYPRRLAARSSRQFLAGITYVWHSPAHRSQILANIVIGTFAYNFPIFFSSFAVLVLHHGNAHAGSVTFGLAESINATFATIGGLLLARRRRIPTRGRYVGACLGLGVALLLAALAPDTAFFLVDMAIFGVCVIYYATTNQTLLQLTTPREKIGSVMALQTYGSQGTTPIGSLVAGWLIVVGTARLAIGIGAASALGSGLVLGVAMLRRPRRTDPGIEVDGGPRPS